MTHSYFNAAFTTVADALKSGNTTLITNAMVYKVLTDPKTNKASGVMYIDRVTREVKEVRARAVLLCAQALESARILLNSSPGRPGQLERRARPLPDGSHLGRRRRERRVPGYAEPEAVARRGAASQRHLRHPDEEHHQRTAPEGLPARLRLPGRRQHELPHERARLRPGVQEGRARSADLDQPGRLRRGAAALRQLRRDRPQRRRHVRHPGAAHHDVVGREREEDDPRHGGRPRRR